MCEPRANETNRARLLPLPLLRLAQMSQRRVNSLDSTVFWVGLFVPAALWVLFALGALLRLNFEWLLIVAVALGLNGANVIGYMRCRKGAHAIDARPYRLKRCAQSRSAECLSHRTPPNAAQTRAPNSKGWWPTRACPRGWARSCATCPSQFSLADERAPPRAPGHAASTMTVALEVGSLLSAHRGRIVRRKAVAGLRMRP